MGGGLLRSQGGDWGEGLRAANHTRRANSESNRIMMYPILPFHLRPQLRIHLFFDEPKIEAIAESTGVFAQCG